MIPREDFSERRFPGWLPWLRTVVGVFWMYGILSALLEAWLRDRAPVAIDVLVLGPALGLSMIGLLAFFLARSLRLSSVAVLQALLPWTLLLLAAIPIDALLGAVGWASASPFMNAREALISVLTGGLFPRPLISLGTLAAWWGILSVSFFTVRRLADNHWRAWEMLAKTFFIFPLLFLAPSMLAWTTLPAEVSMWSAGRYALGRAFVSLNIDGYWWKNIFERFPLAGAGEAQVSGQWFLTALAFLLVFGVGAWLMIRAVSWSRSTWIIFLRSWNVAPRFGLLLVGVALAYGERLSPRRGFVDLVAWILLAVVFVCFWMSRQARHDLLERAHDEQHAPDRPLVAGLIRPSLLQDMVWLSGGAALVGAWLLGWPIFLSVLLAYLAYVLHDTQPLYARTIFPGGLVLAAAAEVSWFFVGWFFAAEQATLVHASFGLAAGLSVVIAAFFLEQAWSERALMELPIIQRMSARWGIKRLETAIRSGLPLSYLVFPVLYGNLRVGFVAFPLALASLVLKGRSSLGPSISLLLLLAFLLLTSLLLASGWFQLP